MHGCGSCHKNASKVGTVNWENSSYAYTITHYVTQPFNQLFMICPASLTPASTILYNTACSQYHNNIITDLVQRSKLEEALQRTNIGLYWCVLFLPHSQWCIYWLATFLYTLPHNADLRQLSYHEILNTSNKVQFFLRIGDLQLAYLQVQKLHGYYIIAIW